jgi:hypothetical protein
MNNSKVALLHGISRGELHIPTKFTSSHLVISAYYATLANPELRRRRLKDAKNRSIHAAGETGQPRSIVSSTT